MTASAPATNRPRRERSPCLLILPSLCFPPLECFFGTSPIQAEKLRPDRKTFGSACVDGSELARAFFTFCSIGRCSHVFGLLMRFTDRKSTRLNSSHANISDAVFC